MNTEEVITAIEEALDGAIDPELYDISHGESDDPSTIELATDEWTLVLESWPDGIGFLALDDEPESGTETELRATLTKIVGDFLPPLKTVNAASGGQISSALERTTDPLSNALAGLLRG